ncbi:MAG TPA: DUF3575 domain-containing protein [Pedobacter sp.]|jgi:hypothetical protein
MKTFCQIFFVIISLSVYAQDKKFALSSNLLNLAALGPSVAFTYNTSPRIGYQIYASTGSISAFEYDFKTVIAEVRYTFWDYVYVGPYIRYIEKRVVREGSPNQTGLFTIPGRDLDGQGLSSGLVGGFKAIDTKKVNMEAFAGLGLGKFTSQIESGHRQKPTSWFPDARVGFLIGYKWGTIHSKKKN